MDGVEFLPPEESDDEPAEREPREPRPRWLIAAARIGAVAVAVAALSVWVASRPSGTTANHQAAQVTDQALPAAPTRPTRNVMVTCSLGSAIPSELTDPMHRFLPGVVVDNLLAHRCVTRAPRLRTVSEAVTGTYRGVTVDVSVSLRTSDFPPFPDPIPASGTPLTPLGTIETEAAGVKVRVIVLGTGARKPPMYRLQRLADFISLNTVL
jgi:hypothetical protein